MLGTRSRLIFAQEILCRKLLKVRSQAGASAGANTRAGTNHRIVVEQPSELLTAS